MRAWVFGGAGGGGGGGAVFSFRAPLFKKTGGGGDNWLSLGWGRAPGPLGVRPPSGWGAGGPSRKGCSSAPWRYLQNARSGRRRSTARESALSREEQDIWVRNLKLTLGAEFYGADPDLTEVSAFHKQEQRLPTEGASASNAQEAVAAGVTKIIREARHADVYDSN